MTSDKTSVGLFMQCEVILLRNEMKGALALVHLLQYSLYTHFENFFRAFLSFSFPLSCSNSLHPPFKISVQNDKLFDFSNCTHELTRVLPFYTPCIFLKSLCILQRYFMNTIFLKKRLFLFVLWICVWSGGAVDWWMPDETDFDTFGRIFSQKMWWPIPAKIQTFSVILFAELSLKFTIPSHFLSIM